MAKTTIKTIQEKKKQKIPITALTCYDAFSGQLIDEGGIDIALVGDSLANTRLGYPNTLPVRVDEMLHHVRASSRGVHQALLVADMPFSTYEYSPSDAAKTAIRFIKYGRAHAVKVEGGHRIAPSIKAILNANVPVMGHIGLTPQSIHHMGGFRTQGREKSEAARLQKEALQLQKLGVFSLVLEGIPAPLAKKITKSLKIPTIGIGAGIFCDGQILVLDDALGMTPLPRPKFVKPFANVRKAMETGIRAYKRAVLTKNFPGPAQSYK